MGTDRLISDRPRNQEKAVELDRAHAEEEGQQCSKISLEMESTGKKEKEATEEHLAPGFRGWHGRQWALLGIN